MRSKLQFGIRSKIMVSYLFIILFVLISVTILNNQISNLQTSRNFVIDHDFKVHQYSGQIEKDLLEMESGIRGYLASNDVNYLQPYNLSASRWKDTYNQLYPLLKDNPAQQQRLANIHDKINDWIVNVGDPAISFKRNNNTEELNRLFQSQANRSAMSILRDQLTSFQNIEFDLTKQRAADLDKQNNNISVILYGSLFLLTILIVVISMLLSNSIVGTLKRVTETIRGIASSKGDLSARIEVKTNDEVRELGMATNELLQSAQDREWLQTQIAEVIMTYQGISSLQKLSENVLFALADKTNATLGALYMMEETEAGIFYTKAASFADGQSDIGRHSFHLGEGLIGQCALQKQSCILENIPEEHRIISSGLLEVQPQTLLIAPVLFEDKVIAVLELASLSPFTPIHQSLLEQVLDKLGLTINAVTGRMEIQRLLMESQAMTEELQAQSEELQTQAEELQMQAEELRTTNEQLEERTDDAEKKSHELEQATLALEEKAKQLILGSKYKSEFLANMSHELRTPLNSILILSEMLSENTETLSDEEQELAKVIHSSGKDLLALINDILDLSKVEAGKLDIIFSEMNMSELPIQVERNFMHLAQQKNLTFHITKDESIADLFFTDEKRLHQILKNLLANAFKFTDDGSVSVRIEKLKAATLTTPMKVLSEDWVTISVTDTGIGIAKEKHKLIFDAFQQADGATVRKYGGTGLGLSICNEFAKLLGGWITVDSDLGNGSTFTLYLPSLPNGLITPADFTAREIAASVPQEQELHMPVIEEEVHHDTVFAGKRILVVDDDHRNIFALQTALQKQGIRVTTARDGVECLEILQTRADFDLILMDIMMPNMDGYETMEHIRLDLHQDIPIIALTAKAMKDDRMKCLQAGASDYISKPLDLQQLFSAMRVWLVK